MSRQAQQGGHLPSVRSEMEKAMGIIFYSSPVDTGLQGEIRKRYMDFLVNELRKDGTVLHLLNYETPNTSNKGQTRTTGPNKTFTKDQGRPSGASSGFTSSSVGTTEIAAQDRSILEGLIGKDSTNKVIDLDNGIQRGGQMRMSPVAFPAGLGREQRTNTHQQIRRIFSSRISTETDDQGVIMAKLMGKAMMRSGPNRQGKWHNRDEHPNQHGFAALGGEYLHFTLFKVNKDTMDAINNIARALKIKANAFGFAGTKDRRAATVQRLSVRYQRAGNLIWLNDKNSGFKVGDFEHHSYAITLGQHGGNQFVITVKNCYVARGVGCSVPRQVELVEQAVDAALTQITKHGFINYFGLQRFGTHTIGTHEVGIKILQEDFEGAVDAILHAENGHNVKPQKVADQTAQADEMARYRAITLFKVEKNAEKALHTMPKRYTAEYNIIRHLSQPNLSRDYVNALLTITRGMRMMYIHAYQSYVWNHAASYRWSNFGSNVIVGDLVLESISDMQQAVPPSGDERDEDQNDEHYNAKAHALTAEEVASGRYTIFDIVLPTPGYDVWYPANAVGEFYKDFMGRKENGGLDPYSMRRKNKEFSLSGNYRYLIGRFIHAPAFSVRTYTDDVEQMYPTDDDIIQQRKKEQKEQAPVRPQTLEPRRTVPNPNSDYVDKITGWNNWAINVEKHDKEELAEHKRMRASVPKLEGTTITDTWTQTAVRENKRVNVGKDVRQIYHVNTHGKSGQATNAEETKHEPSLSGEAMMRFTEDAGATWNEPAVVTLPLKGQDTAVRQPSPPLLQGVKRTATEAGLSTEAGTEGAAGTAQGDRRRSDAIDSTDGPALHNTSEPQPNKLSSSSRSSPAVDLLSDNPIPEDSRAVQRAARTTVSPPPQHKEMPLPPPAPENKPASVNGIAYPNFRVIGADSTTSPILLDDVGTHSTSTKSFAEGIASGGKAKKIAVVLKFSLRSSNYATIALREIMGTVPAPESRPGSRPGSS